MPETTSSALFYPRSQRQKQIVCSIVLFFAIVMTLTGIGLYLAEPDPKNRKNTEATLLTAFGLLLISIAIATCRFINKKEFQLPELNSHVGLTIESK